MQDSAPMGIGRLVFIKKDGILKELGELRKEFEELKQNKGVNIAQKHKVILSCAFA